jgi:hypothetical protein
MGGGASTEAELTPEEKAQISTKVQKQYDEIKKDEGEAASDVALFDKLKR